MAAEYDGLRWGSRSMSTVVVASGVTPVHVVLRDTTSDARGIRPVSNERATVDPACLNKNAVVGVYPNNGVQAGSEGLEVKSTLKRQPTEGVTDDLGQRMQDMAWSVEVVGAGGCTC